MCLRSRGRPADCTAGSSAAPRHALEAGREPLRTPAEKQGTPPGGCFGFLKDFTPLGTPAANPCRLPECDFLTNMQTPDLSLC